MTTPAPTWDQLLQSTLGEWINRPAEPIDEDGYTPPTHETIELAWNVGRKLRDTKIDVPHAIIPNANGGVVFEWRGVIGVYESLDIENDASFYYYVIHNLKVMLRLEGKADRLLHGKPGRTIQEILDSAEAQA